LNLWNLGSFISASPKNWSLVILRMDLIQCSIKTSVWMYHWVCVWHHLLTKLVVQYVGIDILVTCSKELLVLQTQMSITQWSFQNCDLGTPQKNEYQYKYTCSMNRVNLIPFMWGNLLMVMLLRTSLCQIILQLWMPKWLS